MLLMRAADAGLLNEVLNRASGRLLCAARRPSRTRILLLE